MQLAKLFYNTGAGEEEYTQQELVSKIEAAGFRCTSSALENFEVPDSEIDFIIIAGGDGTVRQVTAALLNRKVIDKKFPIALLPLGTANNIAKTLGIPNQVEDVIESWKKPLIKEIDIGRIYGLPQTSFFIEGFGYGLFPRLMKEMKAKDRIPADSAKTKIQTALQVLYDTLDKYQSKYCRIEADGRDYSGNYLLVEVMNICAIGPHLNLAPAANPDDGVFELILLKPEHKNEFAAYIRDKINGTEGFYQPEAIPVKNIRMHWYGNRLHADDALITTTPLEVKIELQKKRLEFLV